LPIEAYFQQIRELIDSCRVVTFSDVNYHKQGIDIGFIRGNIYFIDGSILHFREFVDIALVAERLMYSYHYMSTDKHLLFRYDNADHHHELALSTHPHHKHDGDEETIVASTGPTLADVLTEIEPLVQLP